MEAMMSDDQRAWLRAMAGVSRTEEQWLDQMRFGLVPLLRDQPVLIAAILDRCDRPVQAEQVTRLLGLLGLRLTTDADQ